MSEGFPSSDQTVLEVRNIEMLKKAMNWKKHPILGDAYLSSFDYLEDLNDRRIRDAEVIGASCCNHDPRIVLEIGTAHGHTTALMARNAPQADVYYGKHTSRPNAGQWPVEYLCPHHSKKLDNTIANNNSPT